MRACARTSTKPIACSRASWCSRARSTEHWARRRSVSLAQVVGDALASRDEAIAAKQIEAANAR